MEKRQFPMFYSPLCEGTLDDIVKTLQEMKNNKVNYFYDFLGHNLYSDTVTIDGAYQEVYKMSRDEYRNKLREEYKNHLQREQQYIESMRKKRLDREKQIYDQAREIIPADKMNIFDEVLNSLLPRGIFQVNEVTLNTFFELLKELNKEDYSLSRAKELFEKIMPKNIAHYLSLLKCIKQLAIHGNVLFDEKEKQIIEAQKGYARIVLPPLTPIPSFDNQNSEQSEESELTLFDRKVTGMSLLAYSVSKKLRIK